MSTDINPRSRALRQAFAVYGFLLAALIIELLIFEGIGRATGKPGFLSAPSLLQVLNRSAELGVCAVGMTFVILTAGIDLSVGSVFAFCAVIAMYILDAAMGAAWGVFGPTGWILVAYLIALAAGALSGGAAGLIITRANVPPFIATLALMSTLRGLAFLMSDGQPIRPPAETMQYVTILGRYRIGDYVQLPVIVMIVVFIVGGLLLSQTRFGRNVLAVGGNEEAARLSGVDVNAVKFRVYVGVGFLSALSGLILSSKLGSGDPKIGQGDELDVIAAVVVGGTSLMGGRGSIIGTFLGLAIISALNQGLTWVGVQSFGQQVILGIVILAAVLIDQLKGNR